MKRMPTEPLRVAAAQAESVSGDVEANVETARRLVEQTADGDARLVVLPELFLTGYTPGAWSTIALPDDRLRPLAEVAARRHLTVVVSAGLDGGTGPTIGALVVDGDGVRKAYDKQHLTDEEKSFFVPGSTGGCIGLEGWRLGLGICYDGCFPEHAMAAAEEGAQAYLCPAAYYVGSEHRRDLYYAARALDNGMYVVLAGLTGRCGEHEFSGGSAVYDPEGRPIHRLGRKPGLVLADLDEQEVRRVRAINPIGRDRAGAR
jgi:predicted amidohydrolase